MRPGKPDEPIGLAIPPLPPPENGCKYEQFESTCELLDVTLRASGARHAALARYKVVGQERDVPWNLFVQPDRLAAAEAHLRAHPTVKCVGLRLVSGEHCGPGRVRVAVPPLPVQEASLPPEK